MNHQHQNIGRLTGPEHLLFWHKNPWGLWGFPSESQSHFFYFFFRLIVSFSAEARVCCLYFFFYNIHLKILRERFIFLGNFIAVTSQSRNHDSLYPGSTYLSAHCLYQVISCHNVHALHVWKKKNNWHVWGLVCLKTLWRSLHLLVNLANLYYSHAFDLEGKWTWLFIIHFWKHVFSAKKEKKIFSDF